MSYSCRVFPVNRQPDGRALLNVGSNARVAPFWNNVDFSWLLRLSRFPRVCRMLRRANLLSPARYDRILKLAGGSVVVWDLRKGIPFPDGVFDAVYHCHVIEHIDRDGASDFLVECCRVLKPGGILRVVVPDLETMSRRYLECIDRLPDNADMTEHSYRVDQMFDQMIIRTPKVRREQPLPVRIVEHFIIGDTARAGVLHRWAYDRFSMAALMRDAGLSDIQVRTATTSRIAGWEAFHLDTEADGSPYKPDSLYIEGQKRGQLAERRSA